MVYAAKYNETQVIRALKEESHNMAIFDLAFDMAWRRIKVVQSHGAFERLWHKRSKVCKAVVSLNAFDIRDQRYAKPWCLWTPLMRIKTVVKVIDMFDLAFDRDQMYSKSIRYLIPPLTWVKGGVKVKITFALFFVMDQTYRQSHDVFDTFDARQSLDQSYDHIWPRLWSRSNLE